MDKIKLIQETAKEMYGCSFDEIEQGGRSLLVLNRCLDIVIEQLELTAVGNRRELLIAYEKKRSETILTGDTDEEIVDQIICNL
jgi:hypothetical protein